MSTALPFDRYPVLLKGLRTTQIIVCGLLAGVIVLGGVFVALRMGKIAGPVHPGEGIALTPLLIVFAGVQVLMMFVLRSVLISKARREIRNGLARSVPRRAGRSHWNEYLDAGDTGHLFKAWMTRTIVTAACLEAGALLCLVAYFLEGESASLIAGAVFGLLLATQIPTRGRLDQWLRGELLRLGTKLAKL